VGVTFPRDVAFITLDHEGAVGAVAGVTRRMEDVGAALVRMLAMKIELNETGSSTAPQSLLLQPAWVDGRSLQKRE